MHREYHVDQSAALGRSMERLVFGHAGVSAVVFPTSCGRFHQFEDCGMVAAVQARVERGDLQLVCVDSVDSESWYAQDVPGRWRMARHLQYERYIMHEVLPGLRARNGNQRLLMIGCSMGGFHAVSMALRHPSAVEAVLSMGGAFEKVSPLLRGHYDDDAYFALPTHFLPGLQDTNLLDAMRQTTYTLATGQHDMCWNDNEQLAATLRAKGIPVRLEVWGGDAGHDWPWWRQMLPAYI